MQASQRNEYNHALEYAISKSNELNKPLVVYFGITDNYPEANERHYYFMLEGLEEVQFSLKERGIKMVIRHISPEVGTVGLSKDASLAVVDMGYLKIQKKWHDYASEYVDCPLIQVESDVIVPVEEASQKEEYYVATFRPKIKKKLDYYLVPLRENYPELDSLHINLDSLDLEDVGKIISNLNIDRSVKRVTDFHGGTHEVKKHLEDFLKNKLDKYPEIRNNPTQDCLSNTSPYLHFWADFTTLHCFASFSKR